MIGGNLYDHLRIKLIFTLIVNKIFMRAPQILRKMTTALIWICYLFCTNCVLNILRQESAELNIYVLGSLTLDPRHCKYIIDNQYLNIKSLGELFSVNYF